MSHEGDDGIVGRIVKAVKRHRCACSVAGACMVGFGCAVYMKSGTEKVMECKEAVMKKEKAVIGAKVITVSNNTDVETVNLDTESRFTEGPEIDIEQPSGPQNSKEEKKRKERERRRRLLALAGMTAGIKIMSMMPNPDPNENNRLPDKIPNIPTPQEKWFKWLWEKREMRFEYRPLEFVRAYADKYLEGDAKCVKVGYSYVYNDYYTCNHEIENMKLAKFIILLSVVNSAAPEQDVTNSKLTPDLTGNTSSLQNATTESGLVSSEAKHTCSTYHSRLSDISTKVPSDEAGSGDEAKFVPPEVAPQTASANDGIRLTKARLQAAELYRLFSEFSATLYSPNMPFTHTSSKYAECDLYKFYVKDLQQLTDFIPQILHTGCNVIWDANGSGALLLPKGASCGADLIIFFGCYGIHQKLQIKNPFNVSSPLQDKTRNDLIKAALKAGPGVALDQELTALGFSWFPKAETKPIIQPNPTISTAYHTGTSSTPSIASLTKELNSEREKVAAQAKEIADKDAEIKRLKTANSELKQKQQRCTCGAK